MSSNDTPATPAVSHMVEALIKCKWSMHVLGLVRKGVVRPGKMVRTTKGLSAKVLNERLQKMVRYGVLKKVSYPKIPPHVEYTFTPFGKKFIRILDSLERLQKTIRKSQ